MSEAAAASPVLVASRQAEAMHIVNANCGWATAAGIIPVAFLDLAAIAAVQYRMVYQLTKLYGIEYKKGRVDAILGALAGSGGVVVVAPSAASLLKVVPFVGTLLSTFVVPATAAAATFALGKVLIEHFEMGGTLLTFDANAVRKHYYDEFTRSNATVAS